MGEVLETSAGLAGLDEAQRGEKIGIDSRHSLKLVPLPVPPRTHKLTYAPPAGLLSLELVRQGRGIVQLAQGLDDGATVDRHGAVSLLVVDEVAD